MFLTIKLWTHANMINLKITYQENNIVVTTYSRAHAEK